MLFILIPGSGGVSSTGPQLARGEASILGSGGSLPRGALPEGKWLLVSGGGRVELSNAAAIDAARAMLLWFEPSVTVEPISP